MLGVLQSAVSDFSAFCYPRSPYSSVICNDAHESDIEERYCPKEHVHYFDDREWEDLLAQGLQLFNDSEADPISLVPELVADSIYDIVEPVKTQEDEKPCEAVLHAPPPTPASSTLSTPSLIGGHSSDDALSTVGSESGAETEYSCDSAKKQARTIARSVTTSGKRKRGRASKAVHARKRLCRSDSTSSIATISSTASIGSNPSSTTQQLLQSMMNSDNPWKCPHCPWIQHTQRLPDFLRHQRSHFVSQSDWPCPNPKCGKGFARKDSLKRHLDNKATGCKRPPGYTIC